MRLLIPLIKSSWALYCAIQENNGVERLHEYVGCKSITRDSVCHENLSIFKPAQLPVSDY